MLSERLTRLPNSITLTTQLMRCPTEPTMNLVNKNRSHLFTVRVWLQPGDRSGCVLRIKVQHLLSGEVRYFRNWSGVVAFLEAYTIQKPDDERN